MNPKSSELNQTIIIVSKFNKHFLFTSLLVFFSLLLTITSSGIAGNINSNLKKIIKNLPLTNNIEIIKFKNSKFIVSIGDATVSNSTPTGKVNALKKAKLISQSNLSTFISGESISIKEKLSTIRIVEDINGKSNLVKDQDTYEEYINCKSKGLLKNIDFIHWFSEGVYYVATIAKIS